MSTGAGSPPTRSARAPRTIHAGRAAPRRSNAGPEALNHSLEAREGALSFRKGRDRKDGVRGGSGRRRVATQIHVETGRGAERAPGIPELVTQNEQGALVLLPAVQPARVVVRAYPLEPQDLCPPPIRHEIPATGELGEAR